MIQTAQRRGTLAECLMETHSLAFFITWEPVLEPGPEVQFQIAGVMQEPSPPPRLHPGDPLTVLCAAALHTLQGAVFHYPPSRKDSVEHLVEDTVKGRCLCFLPGLAPL